MSERKRNISPREFRRKSFNRFPINSSNTRVPSILHESSENSQVSDDQIQSTSPINGIHNSNNYITVENLGNNGRLGNQLFQVASTIGIGIKNNVSPIFNSWYCTYTNKDMSVYFKNKLNYRSDINPQGRYLEKTFNYHEVNYLRNMSIMGYFQSDKYFSHCEDIIRYYLEPSDFLFKKICGIYKKLGLEDKKTCSLHIRRGDYVDHPLHGVCNIDYYKRAVLKIKEIKNIDSFLIFSDDIKWCRDNFKSNEFIFSEGLMDIEDIFLMSLCDNHIISNSSFSWWGSWLCKKENKIIITPTRWFNPGSNINDRDVFPSNCIKI